MAPGKAKQFRRKCNASESSDEADETGEILKSTRELQQIRKRQTGVNATALATGIKVTKLEAALNDNDPFKLKTGGLVHIANVKDRNRDRSYEDVDRDVTNLGSTFSVETNRRDEDAELSAYIENELKRIKGDKSNDESKIKAKSAEDALYEMPEHLRKIQTSSQSEEMLSNQMLSGIPEVDLGIDVKIKNIERTEDAKLKLIADLSKKKDRNASFVASNMAVNYVQHRRYMPSSHPKEKKKEVVPEAPPLVVGDSSRRPNTETQKRPLQEDKATDNYHYDKFRKQMRR